MPAPESLAPFLVYILGGVAGVLGSTLIVCLVWFAMRIIRQLDKLAAMVGDEFHKIDKRVTALEAWRDGVLYGARRNSDNAERVQP